MEKKKILIASGIALLLIIALYYLFSGRGEKTLSINPAFNQYVTAHTHGTISKKSTVLIEFANEVADFNLIGQEDSRELIKLDPYVPGKVNWINARTLEFIPDQLFQSGQKYTLTLDIEELIPEIPDSLGDFIYQFSIKEQYFQFGFEAIQNVAADNLDWQRLGGLLITEDYEDSKNVENVVFAELDGKPVRIKWEHEGDGKQHRFLLDSMKRQTFAQELIISWDGTQFNDGLEGEQKFEILAIGDFRFISASVENGDEQYVSFAFSDPVDPKQDLQGLIRVGDYNLTYVVEGNVVKAYPSVRLIGNVNIQVEPGVRNIIGHTIQQVASTTVNFVEIKPQVRIHGKGVIIPGNTHVPFLFEAVNLSAVDVRVIKIFEKSVLQFLQVNDLDGSRELRRVGHVIANKKIDLGKNPNIDLKSWNIHSLDLADIINTEPGAIYEIAIGFRRSYSLYTCADTSVTGDSEDMLVLGSGWGTPEQEAESSFWDYYQDEQQENYWEDRDNPCKNSYYSSNKIIKRNVLASTIGLTAKMSESNELFVAATDINSTRPLGNITIEVYNYQQHLMRRITTGANGIATTRLDGTPYLLIARQNRERGYLRMDDGLALSISRFDIGGVTYEEGLKGFIYGERGVWRPGDSVFLNFILDDRVKPIPSDHPVLFELKNPSGQVVQRIVTRDHVNRFYSFHTATKADAPTGTYLAHIRVGGVTFTKNVKIETIVPNRLKLKIDFDVDYLSSKTTDYETGLQVNWLHGAVGKNLDATVEATLVESSTKFPKYSEFVFDDPTRKFYAEDKVIFEGKLDDEGKATIKANIGATSEAPGMLTANFVAKAFEPGGNFSVDRFSVPFSPYETYVGIKTPKGDRARGMILTDTNHTVKVVTVTPDGKKAEGKKVNVNLYKLEWKWWWDRSAYNVNYNGRYFNKPLLNDTVVTKNGVADWALRLNYPEWGRYLVRACDEDGHCTGKVIYMDWPGWAGRGEKENNAGSSMLSFTADKKSYDVGDDITLNIPTGASGRALLTIESGDKVIDSYWINTVKGTTRFSFPASPEMAPNVYAHISLLQPHAQTANDRPIRMYGVIPIMVKDPNTILKPEIKMPDVLAPETDVLIEVSEANKRSMTYTLAIVDEGLLDLTRFRTPEPWFTFYQRQALKVKTWDLFDHILGAEASKITSLLSIGGDGDLAGKGGGKKQNRFKPVVKFLGPFTLNAGESKQHKVHIPNYIGSVKTMVVAGYKGAYGSTDKAVPVKKPLMVLGSLPRVISPEENVTMPVTIFAMENHIKKVDVKLETNSLVEIDGPATQSVNFQGMGDKLVNFNMKVKKRVGKATVKITAKSGTETATYFVDVDVKSPNLMVTDVYSKTIEAGQSWKQSTLPKGISGTNSAIVEISSIPPLNLGTRLEYLIRYPHGCIEQTTSSVFPQLYLKDLMSLSDKFKAEIDSNVKAGIGRLMSFQTSDGGMSYWPGLFGSDEWGTNYAGHFLIEAQNAGYSVPSSTMAKWTSYQNKKARSWTVGDINNQLTQAYRLYLLALSGNPELSAMNRMRQNRSLTVLAKWYLATAYELAARPEVVAELTKGLSTTEITGGDYRRSYGSDMRNRALLLEALTIGKKWNAAEKIAEKLSAQLNDEQWHSTQSTAFALVAMAKYAGKTGSGKPISLEYRIDGGEWVPISSTGPVWQLKFNNEKSKDISIKAGDDKLYAKVLLKGVPIVGDMNSNSNGLKVDVTYYDMEGDEIDISDLEQGVDFNAQISVENTTENYVSELALTYVVPSGWEIHNDRLDGVDGTSKFSKPEYQDIRDDRVHFYFYLTSKQKNVFQVKLNATYLGRYYLPSAYVEAMYDNAINGRSGGAWVEVNK